MHRTNGPGDEEKDQRPLSIQYIALQPNSNNAWLIISKKAMYCGLIAVGLIAGIIVLARFSTYLSPKDSNESNAASSKMVARSAGVLDSSMIHSAKKRQAIGYVRATGSNSGQCSGNAGATCNLFTAQVAIQCPPGYSTVQCQEYNANVQSYIANQHPTVNLEVPFTNPGTGGGPFTNFGSNVQLTFCSFGSSTGNCATPVITGITNIVINPLANTSNITSPSESPTFGGRTFGNVGAYEKLRGTAYGQLDPYDRRNSLITDIQLAPRNKLGLVEYAMDFYILKPINLADGNHKVFFEVNNRGNKLFGTFDESSGGNNPTTASDAGQAFLMNQGYTLAWCGWDPEVGLAGSPDLLRIYLPTATNPDGSSITGPSYEYIVFDNPTSTSYTTYYNTSTLDTTMAKLTVKNHLTDTPVIIPSTNWTWTSSNTISLLPLNTPFKQSWIYELVYTPKDPYVAGIGFAATRDFVSFLRSARADNPLAGDPTRVVSWSLSQPSRYMNDFIWLGFNEDLNGQQVFDGVFNWVGAGTGVGLNYRFAQSGRTERNRQHHLYPEGRFPFSYTTLTDPYTGLTDGRLRRCTQTNTCPNVMNINSANEYWVKTGTLLHTDTYGKDLPDPPNVRHYLISGSQHGGPSAANSLGICQQFGNTIDPNPALRALWVALDQWLDGTQPPASMVPTHSDGTIFSSITTYSPLGIGNLSQIAVNWPTIPDVLYTGLITVRNLFNFGPLFDQGIITIEPPVATGHYYPSFVSKVDVDGNELAGIRLPPVAVPVGTNAGWNLRSAAYAGNDGCESTGSLIPFAPNKTARIAIGDPRLSLAERYGTHSNYVALVTAAANALVSQRLLLSADAQAYITAAQAPIQVVGNPTYGSYTW